MWRPARVCLGYPEAQTSFLLPEVSAKTGPDVRGLSSTANSHLILASHRSCHWPQLSKAFVTWLKGLEGFFVAILAVAVNQPLRL